jgi:hypothetical protein
MLSSRYAPAICVALLVALIPTVIHSYAGVVVTDHLTTALVPQTIGAYRSTPSTRDANWGQRRFESHDWFERQYVSGADSVVLTVIRSFDLKALYHHPELAVAYHFASFTESRTAPMPGHPEMPVHVLSDREGGPIGMYVLHYDGRFVADPIRFQVRTAAELLFTGRKAMTLFFVRDDTVAEGADPLKLPAASLLASAASTFETAGPAR